MLSAFQRVYNPAIVELELILFGKSIIAPLPPLVNSAAAGDSGCFPTGAADSYVVLAPCGLTSRQMVAATVPPF